LPYKYCVNGRKIPGTPYCIKWDRDANNVLFCEMPIYG
jgi:hypothetical protein